MINKKLLTASILGVFAIMLVSAVLVYSVTRDANVSASFLQTGGDSSVAAISGGEIVSSGLISLQSQTSVNVPVLIETSVTPLTTEATSTNVYVLDNTGGVCGGGSTTCEKRLTIQSKDVGVLTLNDLDTVEWDADATGYLPHVDVIVDIDGDGIGDDALVFEYAKVQPVCDNAPYPTGVLNTFGDKGIVDSTAKAWLSSGVPGPCGDPAFEANYMTLANWKLTGASGIDGNTKVLRLEIEVDAWILESSSEISNVLVNGLSVQPTLKPLDFLDFRVDTEFSIAVIPDTYTISTTITPDTSRV